jgi:hypothetical protein
MIRELNEWVTTNGIGRHVLVYLTNSRFRRLISHGLPNNRSTTVFSIWWTLHPFDIFDNTPMEWGLIMKWRDFLYDHVLDGTFSCKHFWHQTWFFVPKWMITTHHSDSLIRSLNLSPMKQWKLDSIHRQIKLYCRSKCNLDFVYISNEESFGSLSLWQDTKERKFKMVNPTHGAVLRSYIGHDLAQHNFLNIPTPDKSVLIPRHCQIQVRAVSGLWDVHQSDLMLSDRENIRTFVSVDRESYVFLHFIQLVMKVRIIFERNLFHQFLKDGHESYLFWLVESIKQILLEEMTEFTLSQWGIVSVLQFLAEWGSLLLTGKGQYCQIGPSRIGSEWSVLTGITEYIGQYGKLWSNDAKWERMIEWNCESHLGNGERHQRVKFDVGTVRLAPFECFWMDKKDKSVIDWKISRNFCNSMSKLKRRKWMIWSCIRIAKRI